VLFQSNLGKGNRSRPSDEVLGALAEKKNQITSKNALGGIRGGGLFSRQVQSLGGNTN